jgi:hypothetical protein
VRRSALSCGEGSSHLIEPSEGFSGELFGSVLELSDFVLAHARTGVLLLWQYPGAKGTVGHVTRWASALFISVFVVYMNTVTALNQPPMPITNLWHVRFMAFHQKRGTDLLWLDGGDAGSGWIVDGNNQAWMAKVNRSASCP